MDTTFQYYFSSPPFCVHYFILAPNIHWEGWGEILKKFKATNNLVMGKEYFPDQVYNNLNIGDFNDAGIFNGDYRDLIIEISKYVDFDHENKLLPSLQRKNDPVSIYYAIIYAVCDVISEGRFVKDVDCLKNQIYSIAKYKYAVAGNSIYADTLVLKMVNILLELKNEHQHKINGPFFLSKETLLSMKDYSYITHEEPYIQVTDDGKFLSLV